MSLTIEQEERLSLALNEIGPARAKLSDWERGFFDDHVDKYHKYGSGIRISPKQWAIFDRMIEKVRK